MGAIKMKPNKYEIAFCRNCERPKLIFNDSMMETHICAQCGNVKYDVKYTLILDDEM
jgi:rRNA maturation endonuclease Nob1